MGAVLRDLVLPSYAQMLDALAGQLAKAKGEVEGGGTSIEDLLSARLAPDMLPLSSQVQFACLQAEEVLGRLFDQPIEAVDVLETFDQAKALLAKTAERLRAAASEDGSVDPTRPIELKLPNGMTFDLDLFEYVRSWSVPQFHFHLITAYAILRQEGVRLGKADYVPHMFQFLRPGAT